MLTRRTFMGAWIETSYLLKFPVLDKSHLHGCVNWNQWVEKAKHRNMSHLHGCVNWNQWVEKAKHSNMVAPSWVRELKLVKECSTMRALGRTFMGAWIETSSFDLEGLNVVSHLHGCVNWNMSSWHGYRFTYCRTFMGAWIETNMSDLLESLVGSHLHGCVNWNISVIALGMFYLSHLHGCVNWNQSSGYMFFMRNVAPSWVRELKLEVAVLVFLHDCRTFMGAWIETEREELKTLRAESHLHGCVNWNLPKPDNDSIIKVAPSWVRELKPVHW